MILPFRAIAALTWGLGAAAQAQPGEATARERMQAALEAQATLPSEPPGFPSLDRAPLTPRAGPKLDDRSGDAQGAAKSHGQASVGKAKDEALRRSQADVANAGQSAAGVARSKAAKEKAKTHPHKPPARP